MKNSYIINLDSSFRALSQVFPFSDYQEKPQTHTHMYAYMYVNKYTDTHTHTHAKWQQNTLLFKKSACTTCAMHYPCLFFLCVSPPSFIFLLFSSSSFSSSNFSFSPSHFRFPLCRSVSLCCASSSPFLLTFGMFHSYLLS